MGKMDRYIPEGQPMDRRSFLRLSGILGLGLASTAVAPVMAEAVKFNKEMFKVSRTRLAMGTFVSMTLIHPSRDRAEEAIGLAFGEIDRLTGLMNRFDERTAVGQLNREGLLKEIPPEVMEVVAGGLFYHRLSGGAFDISVKPVVDLYRKKMERGERLILTERELEGVLELVGSEKVILNDRSIRFKKPGMGITLDGIAKGYIVDKASKILSDHGIEHHLINAGGDIKTVGTKQKKEPWAVAIQDPKKEGRYPDVVHMTTGAIATSGDYEVYYDQEKMFHHIVDPKTGLSPHASTSVSVMAPTATAADALATSVFVMNPEAGIRFIESRTKTDCLVISRKGQKFASSGWKGDARSTS